MKTVQYNQANPSVTVDGAKSGSVVDVSKYGPLTIAVQLVLTSASTPSGITAILQGSLDGTNFFDVGSSINLTADGTQKLTATSVEYMYYRVTYARSSGSIISTERFMVYGDRI